MSVMDGFWLWVGRALAELVMVGGFITLLAVGFFALLFVGTLVEKYKRWKKARKAPQASKGEAA